MRAPILHFFFSSVMWVVTVLSVMTLFCGAFGAREPLREQVAMLRMEQWRDRERIEALERRLLVREERDSPATAGHEWIGDVLEEVRREIGDLADELRQRQNLESVVYALQARQGREASTLRRLSQELKDIRDQQRKISSQLNKEIWPTEGSGEGSGDLMVESLIPVAVTHATEDSKGKIFSTQPTTEAYEQQNPNFQLYEKRFHKKLTDFEEHLEEVRDRMDRAEERCAFVISNVTDEMKTSKERFESMEESFGSLQKNVSKVTFNNVQIQAALHVLTQDRSSDAIKIRDLYEEWMKSENEIANQKQRLTAVEIITTNLSLQRCRSDAEGTNRELQLANLELRLAQVNRRLDEKARISEISRNADDRAMRTVREAISEFSRRTDNISRELIKVAENQEMLKNDLNKFIRQLPKDCSREAESGLKLIQVRTLRPTEVYCDAYTDGGPWLVVQRRADGSEDFFRSWKEYRNGFGQPEAEFWLGNEILNLLTKDRPMKLRVDMWDVLGRYSFAEYDDFKVHSEEHLYTLEIGRHKGNASDALSHHSGMGFSTHDRDHDASSTHCAVHYTAGWWYQHCHRADLNGRYAIGMTWYDSQRHDWIQLERVEMKIKPLGS